jgi:hypothetical protein
MSERVGIAEDTAKTFNVQRPTSNGELDHDTVAAVYDRRRLWQSAATARWRARLI